MEGGSLYDPPPRVMEIKAKISKWYLIKLKSFCTKKATVSKVKSQSEVAQSCPTLSDPTDSSLPGSSVHGIFQAGVLEWGAIAFSTFVVQKLLILIRPHLVIFAFISNILGGGS